MDVYVAMVIAKDYSVNVIIMELPISHKNHKNFTCDDVEKLMANACILGTKILL